MCAFKTYRYALKEKPLQHPSFSREELIYTLGAGLLRRLSLLFFFLKLCKRLRFRYFAVA